MMLNGPLNYGETPTGNIRKQAVPITYSRSDLVARGKLMHYIYEYLVHNGFVKSAEAFKAEVLPNTPVEVGEIPGFLTTWFNLFWELYSGDPERKDKYPTTQEGKAFHEFGFVQQTVFSAPPRPQFMQQGPPGMPNNDGMMTPFPYPRGMPPPYGGNRPQCYLPQNTPGGQMFPTPNDQMRGMQQNRLRMPNPTQMNFGPRPNRYGPPYMESPTSTPSYPQMPNGAMPTPIHDGQHDPRFMQIGGPITSMPQFMGNEQILPNMTPTTSVTNSMGMGPPHEITSHGTTLPPLNSTSLTNLMNGEDIKQSPSHMMHPPNGTPSSMQTPGSHNQMMSGHGPGSAQQQQQQPAPTSVNSQPGQPGSNIPITSSQQQSNINQGQMMEHNMMDFSADNQTPNSHEDLTEIKKIREGLLDDFPPGDPQNH